MHKPKFIAATPHKALTSGVILHDFVNLKFSVFCVTFST